MDQELMLIQPRKNLLRSRGIPEDISLPIQREIIPHVLQLLNNGGDINNFGGITYAETYDPINHGNIEMVTTPAKWPNPAISQIILPPGSISRLTYELLTPQVPKFHFQPQNSSVYDRREEELNLRISATHLPIYLEAFVKWLLAHQQKYSNFRLPEQAPLLFARATLMQIADFFGNSNKTPERFADINIRPFAEPIFVKTLTDRGVTDLETIPIVLQLDSLTQMLDSLESTITAPRLRRPLKTHASIFNQRETGLSFKETESGEMQITVTNRYLKLLQQQAGNFTALTNAYNCNEINSSDPLVIDTYRLVFYVAEFMYNACKINNEHPLSFDIHTLRALVATKIWQAVTNFHKIAVINN